ncbi:MAG: aldo/keto reductase [Lachnospiraceae bacterium]|nr:aldo/keto reductase [Lachnospiraceae bacterium]
METVRFGKTGMMVTPLTLGTWGIGGAGWDENTDETRLDAIAAAVECGINFIDTAPAYNAGKAERYIGKALEQMGPGTRQKVQIATKCANSFIDGQYVRSGRPELILQQCEDSLKNLRTDYIDLLIVHWPDPEIPYEKTFGALTRLKEEGCIRHIGVSNFNQEQLQRAMQCADVEALQLQYSMVEQGNADVLQWAHGQGLGVMTYGSLGGGILTGRYRTLEQYAPMDNRNRFYPYFREPLFSRVMELLKVMEPIAKERGVTLAEIAINWSRQKDFIDTSMFGAQSRQKVESNIKCLDWTLSEEEMEMLDRAAKAVLS